MRLILTLLVLCILACTEQKEIKQPTKPAKSIENLVSVLDTIWRTEQTPIRMRDSLMKIYGVESPEAQKQQEIFEKNHLINEKKVVEILGKHEWPDPEITGESGNLTICNVIQHSDIETRIKYLPIMKEAVKRKKLEPRLLARSEDRLATDSGELQVYGGQIK
ncbi:MAG: hypothetical protein AB8G22_20120 [Saprospiraceae bacterium]